MRYLTAIEASKRIGVAEKTIRLWIKEGKLKAHHPAKNRLAIAEADVERIAKERQLYYGAKPEIPSPIHTLPDISAHDIDTLFTRIAQLESQPEISVLTRELGKLQAKVDVQDARIAELERRITELDAKTYPIAIEPTNIQPVSQKPVDETTKPSTDQNRIVEPNSDMLTVADFAAKIGISYTVLDGYTRRGVRGEKLDVTEVPHPTRAGYTHKYFTIEQQQKTLDLLKKHGKLPGV